ncbi:hypothetical protein ACTND8_02680 [Atopobiaceae bacterium HCP3S3_F7]|uniref:hypothetical protein n=1 Tax=unclassified Collinsella TaxID=2637548 RepID=UPI003E70F795
MKAVKNPLFVTTFSNNWSVSVARVDDGEYRWSVCYTNPEGYSVYSMYETASEVFSELAKVQKYEEDE